MNNNVVVVKPQLEFLDPSMNIQDKIARMARLCYKSEPKGPGSDSRLIFGCVTRGHRSVTEHGQISVVFSLKRVDKEAILKAFPNLDKKDDILDKLSAMSIFRSFSSNDVRRYVRDATDSKIVTIVDPEFVKDNPGKSMCIDVKLANVRAWLRISEAVIRLGMRSGTYPYILALGMSLLAAINKVVPAACEPVINKIVGRLSALAKAANIELEASFDACCELCHASLFDIWAAQADPALSMSVILKTSRSVTHEIVRHNHLDLAVSQESQRFVNYDNKGFEFIHPMLDVVRFADLPLVTEGGTATVTVDEGGYLPEESIIYKRWVRGREADVEEYLFYKDHDLPPEFNRGPLPNDSASSIGLTFTIPSFMKIVKLRLDNTAFFPFRKFMAELIIRSINDEHPFMMSFVNSGVATENTLEWVKYITDNKLYTDVEAIDKAKTKIESVITAMEEARKAVGEAQRVNEQIPGGLTPEQEREQALKKAADQARTLPSDPTKENPLPLPAGAENK